MRACALIVLLATAATAQSPDEDVLTRHGIRPDRESIGRYLRLMFPDAALRSRIDDLVDQLGDPSAGVRDAAMRELVTLQAAPLAALRRAAQSDRPEIRKLARRLIERAQSGLDPPLLYAVLRTIRHRRIAGLTREVLNAMPLSSDFYFREEARRTLLATVRESDREALLEAAADGPAVTRAAAFSAIRAVSPTDAVSVLVPALRDGDEEVRIAAARELAELGDRRALPVLVSLLDASDDGVRLRAHWTLRAIAGESHGFAANAAPDRRAEAVRAWQTWLTDNGATASWKTPLRYGRAVLGRTLIALYTKGKVVEIDASGRVLWELGGLKNPWAVHGMANGHRLVTLYSEHRIAEYDATGKQIWVSEGMGGIVSSTWSTRAGRILVALGYSNNRIVEVDRATKKIVWELNVPGRPVCAAELENGNLLVTLNESNEVVEIDRTGRRIWQVGGLNKPYSAHRLPSGNTLVADYGARRLVEFDRAGNVVWEFKGNADKGGPAGQAMYTTGRLPDGTTLYADNKALRRIDSAGQVVWEYEAANQYLYFHLY